MIKFYRKIVNTLSEMRSYTDNKVDQINNDGSFQYSVSGTRGRRKSNVNTVIRNKDLLISYDKMSIIKLLTFNNRKGQYNIHFESRNEATLPLFLLAMAYLAVFISTNIFAGRFINFFGMVLPGGIFGFPLTFAILDIITEYYGLRIAKKVIYSSILAMFFFVGLISLYYYFGSLYISPQNKEYALAIDKSIYYLFFYHSSAFYIVVSGSIATLVSDTTNCTILSKLKKKWHSKHLWLRCIIATTIGEIIFSFTWLLIYMSKTHILPTVDFLNAVISQTILKSSYEVLVLPITYMIIIFLRYKYGNENAARKAV